MSECFGDYSVCDEEFIGVDDEDVLVLEHVAMEAVVQPHQLQRLRLHPQLTLNGEGSGGGIIIIRGKEGVVSRTVHPGFTHFLFLS